MSLEVYQDNGFRFFPCKANKAPDVPSWQDEKHHVDREKAETLQSIGTMIGAWIPEDVIILDLDRHEGKPDGNIYFKELMKKLNITIGYFYDTTVVKTGGGGQHIFFYVGKDHGLRQGAIKIEGCEIGIDIKTSAGYVIAAGSPGYNYISDADPMEIPEELLSWLRAVKQKPDKHTDKKTVPESKHIPVKLLKSVLRKIDVQRFNTNDRWLEFITSAVAAAGDSAEVIDALEEWSRGDPQYEHHQVINRIKSFKPEGGITIGTFVMFLQEEGVSQYLVNQVVKVDAISNALLIGEDEESSLPFPDPDYLYLSELVEAREFFTLSGNTAAKKLLYIAFDGNVIFCKGDKETYFFNGSRWEIMRDMYSVVYTILFKIAKEYYYARDNSKEMNECLIRVIKNLNDTTWKKKTITEIQAMIREDYVDWDNPAIRETVTLRDGVIDFSNKQIEKRNGYRAEFRLKYIDYSVDDVMNAGEPESFLQFMKELFPDEETNEMAMQLISLCISGNSNKRIFQLWEGDGYNGKSTLIDIIKEILKGKTNTYNPKLLMPDRRDSGLGVTPELASFQGSYAAVGTEVEQGNEFSTGIIKNLTGGDTITANPKFKDQIEFYPTWQLILAVNDLPRFNSLDNAFIDRLYILPFKMTFPKSKNDRAALLEKGIPEEYIGERKDKNALLASIFSEKPAIIKKMISVYLQIENENDGYIKESAEALREKSSYIHENDDFGRFIKDMCIIDDDSFCSSEELTDAFKDYMGFRKASSKWVVSNVKKFNRHIISGSKNLEFHDPDGGSYVTKRRRGLIGIRLKTAAERKEDVYDDEIPF
jgi:P4 family phage/plasmid primase-like protien